MPDPTPRPPDLDASGRPLGAPPPDLDASGMPVAGTGLRDQIAHAQNQPEGSALGRFVKTAAGWLPAAGGAVGGIVGGIPGAAIGGAAGRGYQSLVQHATELPGAVVDVARNLVTHPRETIAGAVGGGMQGATQGAIQGAMQGGAEAAGVGIGKAMSALAPRVMQAAVKPTLKMLGDVVKGREVPKVVETLLEEGVNVTPAGYQKLQALLNTSTAERNQLLSDAVAAGAPSVRPLAVAGRLSETAQQFGRQVNPSADLDAISRAGQEFLDVHGGTDIPIEEANALKQGTYQVLKKKYGQLGSADVEAQKALARGLKEELETLVPGVDLANQRVGDLSQALAAVGRRVAIQSNRDPAGLAWLTHSPTLFMAALMDRHPLVKSLVARGLYNSAAAAARVSPQVIRAGLVGLLSGSSTDQGTPTGP